MTTRKDDIIPGLGVAIVLVAPVWAVACVVILALVTCFGR